MFSAQIDRYRHALSLRLAVWYIAVFVASSAAVVLLTYALLAASLRERDYEGVRELVVRYARAYTRGGIDAVERTVTADRLAARYEPFFVRITRGPNSVAYFALPADWAGLDLSALDGAGADPGEWAQVALGPGEPPLDVSAARLRDGTRMQVGKSSRPRQEALGRFRARALTLLVIVLAAGIAGGAVLTYSALAPLRALTAAIQRILSTGDIRARVPVRRSPDPLDMLSALFNDLLARLEALIEGMRQTLDNTAHDLRTPLTRARSRVEAALQGPPDHRRYAAALEETLDEIDRIAAMLTALMDISEAQTGAMRLSRRPLQVASLFEETLDLYGDVAESRGIVLRAAAPPDLVLDADEHRLRQVLANLVDNAIKYTPRGGHVELRGSRTGGTGEIRVSDTGVGIPREELPRIWDRLFRGDQSRSERGLGLGLSLVKAIVEAHRGTVSVSSTIGQGTTFTVRLPAAAPPESSQPFTDVMAL